MVRKHRVPAPRPTPEQRPVRFSFKHLDFGNNKFRCSTCSKSFFEQLFEQLSRFSTWSVEDFTDQNNRERRHLIDFSETTEPDGFCRAPNIDAEQLGFQEAWQFSVCPSDRANHGRIHGILIDDTFFIVWLDPHHKLYPDHK